MTAKASMHEWPRYAVTARGVTVSWAVRPVKADELNGRRRYCTGICRRLLRQRGARVAGARRRQTGHPLSCGTMLHGTADLIQRYAAGTDGIVRCESLKWLQI
jgi:hypothetical protein